MRSILQLVSHRSFAIHTLIELRPMPIAEIQVVNLISCSALAARALGKPALVGAEDVYQHCRLIFCARLHKVVIVSQAVAREFGDAISSLVIYIVISEILLAFRLTPTDIVARDALIAKVIRHRSSRSAIATPRRVPEGTGS